MSLPCPGKKDLKPRGAKQQPWLSFHSKYPAFLASLGLRSHRHVALAQEGTLWPGPAAPTLEVGCAPETTVHPREDEALVLPARCIKQTRRSRKLCGWSRLRSRLAYLSLTQAGWIQTGLHWSQPHSSSLCSQQGSPGAAGAGFSLQTLKNRNDTLCVAVSPPPHGKSSCPWAPTSLLSSTGGPHLPFAVAWCNGERTRSRWRYGTRKLHPVKYPWDREMYKAGLFRTSLS